MKKEICSVAGCGRNKNARGLCVGHYLQMRAGRAFTEIPRRPDLKKWIKDHASYEEDACLTWPFHRSKNGHAFIKGGSAARRMCVVAHGEPPTQEHEAAHSCGKGHEGCVNPNHLRWATRQENTDDMIAHGTNRIGSKMPWALLTEEKVIEMRQKHRAGASIKQLSTVYGTSYCGTYDAVTGRNWSHI